jgi:hypothetical protein
MQRNLMLEKDRLEKIMLGKIRKHVHIVPTALHAARQLDNLPLRAPEAAMVDDQKHLHAMHAIDAWNRSIGHVLSQKNGSAQSYMVVHRGATVDRFGSIMML